MREPVTAPAGSLHLPKDVGVPETEVAAIENRWETIDRVDANLARAGMLPNNAPDIEWKPVSTEGLVTTDYKEYTTLFAGQLRWYNYANRLLADVRARKLQVDNQLKDIELATQVKYREFNKTAVKADKVSKEEIEAIAASDPSHRALRPVQQELEQMRIKLDAWVDELEWSLKTVSRQIENRKAESDAGRREGNMPGHAARGSGGGHPSSWNPNRGGLRTP